MRVKLWCGDCMERMQELETGSVDGVFCDPPYGLSFMGVAWDTYSYENRDHVSRGDIGDKMGKVCNPHTAAEQAWVRGRENRVFGEFSHVWIREVSRVVQEGGLIKAFGGTRTFHRLAAAMSKVGLQDVRVAAWVYGSGFPKSLNIGKSIDKQGGRLKEPQGGTSSVVHLKKQLRELFDASGKTRAQIDQECGFRACNYLSYPEPGKRPDPWFYVLPSQAKWEIMRHVLGAGGTEAHLKRLDALFQEAVREVIGYKKVVPGVAFSSEGPTQMALTKPATPEAERWEGWGTALKPAWEPIITGRKPCL